MKPQKKVLITDKDVIFPFKLKKQKTKKGQN